MEYKTEFETRNDVKKMFVANGKALYFVPDGTGKYEFCSKDSELQKWCESTKSKRVKANALKFVVGGARDYLKGKTQLREKSNSVKTSFKDNPIDWVNELCQAKQIKNPDYNVVSTAQGGGLSLVSVVAVADWLDEPIGYSASNATIARRKIAEEIATKYFSEELKKEQSLQSENNQSSSKPQQTKQGNPHSIDNAKSLKRPYTQYRWDINPKGTFFEYCQQNGLALPSWSRTQDQKTLEWTMFMSLEGIDHKFKGTALDTKTAEIRAIMEYLKALQAGKIEKTVPTYNNGRDKMNIRSTAKAGFYQVEKHIYSVDDNGNVCQLANKDAKPRFFGKGLWLDFDRATQRCTFLKNNTPIAAYDFKEFGKHGYGTERYFNAEGEPVLKEDFDKIISDTFSKDNGTYTFSKAVTLGKLHEGQALTTLRQATTEEVLEFVRLDQELAETTSRRDREEWLEDKYNDLDDNIDEIIAVQKEITKGFRVFNKPQPQKQPEVKNFDQGLELLKAKFNGGRGGKK